MHAYTFAAHMHIHPNRLNCGLHSNGWEDSNIQFAHYFHILFGSLTTFSFLLVMCWTLSELSGFLNILYSPSPNWVLILGSISDA